MLTYRFVFRAQEVTNDAVHQINGLLGQLSPGHANRSQDHLRRVAKNSRFLIVRDSDRIVAIAALVPVVAPSGVSGRIEDVVVDERYRQRGIADEMVKTLVLEARRMRMEHVNLTSGPQRVAANKLYLKHGFVRGETNVYRLTL